MELWKRKASDMRKVLSFYSFFLKTRIKQVIYNAYGRFKIMSVLVPREEKERARGIRIVLYCIVQYLNKAVSTVR